MNAPKSAVREVLSQATFAALRRQLRGEALRELVGRIEAEFRKALGIAALCDDDVIVSLLEQESREVGGKAESDRACLAAIRMCIGFREALDDGDRDAWLDRIGLSLAHADPARLQGLTTWAERRAGNARSAESRAPEKRHAKTIAKIRVMLDKGETVNAKRLVAKGCSLSTVYKLIALAEAERGRR